MHVLASRRLVAGGGTRYPSARGAFTHAYRKHTIKRGTVRAALEAYLEDLRRQGRANPAADAEWRFKKYVYADPLADLLLERATRDDFEEWRERQQKVPIRKRKSPAGEAGEPRATRTINRQFRSLKAGLNRAVELGYLGNPLAWKLKKLADDLEDSNETAVFLTATQREALLAAAEPSTADFLRAIEETGARPHEIAQARVCDFDGSTIRLAHRKGRPPKLRVRYVTLTQEGIEFFAKIADGKPRDALLFKPDRSESDSTWNSDEARDDVRMWSAHLWARRIRAAISKHNESADDEAAKIPSEASAYSLRHTRISELLQIHNIDPITVAQQTGTSVAMLEKTYFKFIPSAMRAKLASIKESAPSGIRIRE